MNFVLATLAFLYSVVCIFGLVRFPWVTAIGLGWAALTFLVVFLLDRRHLANSNSVSLLAAKGPWLGTWSRQFAFALFTSLALLNALGVCRFFGGVANVVRFQFGVWYGDDVERVRECGNGYVTYEPRCTDLAFPASSWLAYEYFFFMHAAVALISLALGPLQLHRDFRNSHLKCHRWCGRVYVVCNVLSAAGALGLAIHTCGGLVTMIGFVLLDIVWVCTLARGVYAIRWERNIVVHSEWMMRNYACTFGAVTLRLYLPLLLAMGFTFPEAYTIVSWVSWIVNLLVVEIYIRRNKTKVIVSQDMKKTTAAEH